jgi:uncharacterized membrane protein (DUF2068 family)
VNVQPDSHGFEPSAGPAATAARRAVRTVAFFEAFKGVIVLVTATGLLTLIHKDLNDLAERLVRHTHLNPASKYPHIFLDAVARFNEPRLLWLAAGAAAYGALRLLEAWGLYRGRAWAEWLAALSGAWYIPAELLHLLHRRSGLSLCIFIVNVAVVAVMVWALVQRRRSAPASRVA